MAQVDDYHEESKRVTADRKPSQQYTSLSKLEVSQDSPLLTYSGAASLLAMSEFTLRKLVSQRRIPFVKIGRSVRFSRRRLEEWIIERMKEPNKEGAES